MPVLLVPLATEFLPRLRFFKGPIALLADRHIGSSIFGRFLFILNHVMHGVKHKIDLTC
jgi:hypothetical protein